MLPGVSIRALRMQAWGIKIELMGHSMIEAIS